MPAVFKSGDITDHLPANLTPVEIASLRPNTKLSNKYLKAVVERRWQVHRFDVPSIKLTLSDNDGHDIDFLGLGQIAEDLDTVSSGDTVICLKFVCEHAPKHFLKRFVIIANDTKPEQSLVWISKNSSKVQDKPDGTSKNSSMVQDKPDGTSKNSSKVQDKLDGTSKNSSKVQDKPDGTSKNSSKVQDKPDGTSKNSSKVQDKPDGTTGKKKTPTYTYKALSDVQVNTVVDIYGVVKFFRPPSKTKGLDYHLLFGLTDPSFIDPEEKLICSLFNREVDHFPPLQVGDILRLHRVKIQSFGSKLQACNGPGFQWVLFQGSADRRISSSTHYTFEQQDEEKVLQLKEWWEKLTLTTLSQVQPKMYFNLVVQVVRVCELQPKTCFLLRVWDGTLFQGPPIKVTKEEEMKESLKENAVLVKASEGLAVDVYVFDNHTEDAAQVQPGEFVFLENLHAAVVQDQVELTLHGGLAYGRKLMVLPEDDRDVVKLKAVLDPIVERAQSAPQNKKRSRSPDETEDDGTIPNKKRYHDRSSNNNVSDSGPSQEKSHDSATFLFSEENSNGKTSKPGSVEQGSTASVEKFHEVCLFSNTQATQEESIRLTAYFDSQPCSGSTQEQGQCNINEPGLVRGTQCPDEDSLGLSLFAGTQPKSVSVENSLPQSPNLNLPTINVGTYSLDSVNSSPASYHTAPSPEDCWNEGTVEVMSADAIPSKVKHLSLKSKQQKKGCQEVEVSPSSSHPSYKCQQQETSDSQHLICPDTYTIHYVTSQDTNPANNMACQGDEDPAQTNGHYRCMLKTATVTLHHHHVPFSTLSEVLHKKLPYKFRIQAKVKSISPMPLCYHDLIYLYCIQCLRIENRLELKHNQTLACKHCNNNSLLAASLLLTFTLTDGKDTLIAHLLGENALQFFNCGDVFKMKEPNVFKKVKKSLETLCLDNANLDDFPLIECCLLGYVKDGAAVYHIFDTILI